MKSTESFQCPICSSFSTIAILDLHCGNLDDSTLYETVKVYACEQCGHVYNGLLPDEILGLVRYYDEEYAPVNMGSLEKTGDRPGSNDKNTFARYGQLYDLLSEYITREVRVLDIGCAMGGFLDYLQTKGIKSLAGIDPTQKYINYARQKEKFTFKLGSAGSIPFEDNRFDLLVMDQVLEHLAEPKTAFQEAKRVLTEGGLLCIGVPDASRYDQIYFFDFFWFLMREHIQHFDFAHLSLLAEMNGFEMVAFQKSETPMMSDKMILPVLNMIFRLTDKKNSIKSAEKSIRLKKEMKQYAVNEFERLNKWQAVIQKLTESQRPVYVWGIGREFLYLYASAGLKQCGLIGLIDSNPYKQNNCRMDGKKIFGGDILSKATPESILLITAIAHRDRIIKEVRGVLGFKGKIVDL